MKNNRISIPLKIKRSLFYDDQFFREACKIIKLETNTSFPKQDQWCDETGLFHIEFALAGYSPSDLEIIVEQDELVVRSVKNERFENSESERDKAASISYDSLYGLADGSLVESAQDNSDKKIVPKAKMQNGIISRGIARRSFTYGLVLSGEYDLNNMSASMENGLLHVIVPKKENILRKVIKIS